MPNRSTCAFLLLLLLCGACSSSKSRQMAEEQARRTNVTDERLQLEDFVTLLANQIERASDQIAQESSDPSIKRNTVYYKMRVIPVVRRSLQRDDEQAVMMDLWLFSAAMHAFADSDAGREYFGGHESHMQEAGETLEESAQRLAKRLMEPEQFEKASAGIEDFLANHQIDSDLEVDESSQEAWTKVVTSSLGKSVGAVTKPFAALNFTSGISDTAVAVHQASSEVDRARNTLSFMPTDIRWQAQLLLLEIEENLGLTTVVEATAKMGDASESLAKTADEMPQEIRAELTTLLEDLDEKQLSLQATLTEVDQLMTSTNQTAATLTQTGEALTETFQAFDAMMVTLLGPPPDPDAPPPPPKDPDEESKPFDITDYGDTAARVTETATALTALLAEAKSLEESSAAPALIEDTSSMVRGIVTQVFVGAGLLVVFTALVMFVYRRSVRKLAP